MAKMVDPVADKPPGMQLLVDRYRCPAEAAPLMLSGQPGSGRGFFRFDDAICFGQCASGETRLSSDEPLFDALSEVIVSESGITLPFDPDQVVDNLRAERYLGQADGMKGLRKSGLTRRLYYLVRPLISVSFRKHLQKFYFRGWEQIPFPEWPVDFTVEHIHEKLLLLALKARQGRPIPFIWFWPKGAPSCTIVTHDVETQSGVDFCPQLMDVNDAFGVKTSFQIVPEDRYPVTESFLALIRNRGFEVNVHDLNHDGYLFRDRTEFIRRAELINRYIVSFEASGFRSAVMYHDIDWYEALKVKYDMSVPNVSHLDPQQGGCCTVLPFFAGDIVELPVTMTQDYSLFNILGQFSTDLWIEQGTRIRQKHGLLSVIVHPDYLDNAKALKVYKDLLAHLTELRSGEQTWIALPREVAEWWRKRSQMRLVSHGNSWEIEGEGKEQASLAYAFLDGGSLRYELAGTREASVDIS